MFWVFPPCILFLATGTPRFGGSEEDVKTETQRWLLGQDEALRGDLAPRMVLEAAGESVATLVAVITQSLQEIGAGQVLAVVAALDTIPPVMEWCLANGIAVLHLEADRRGGYFWIRKDGARRPACPEPAGAQASHSMTSDPHRQFSERSESVPTVERQCEGVAGLH
jgi:hypothetical protein